MNTCVIVVSNTVREDHNPQPSWKYQKEDKTDMWLSMSYSFYSIVAVYLGLAMQSFFADKDYVVRGLICRNYNICVVNSGHGFCNLGIF